MPASRSVFRWGWAGGLVLHRHLGELECASKPTFARDLDGSR